MAIWYMDNNGATNGFGTLSATFIVGGNIQCSLNNLGNISTTSVPFGSSTTHILNFGSDATAVNTAVGTFTVDNGATAYFNGLRFQNLTGNQTINGIGVTQGKIDISRSPSPFIDVTANGRLDITCVVIGNVNWEKRGASILRLTAANTFSAGMTISAGTVQIGNTAALGTGTVTMTGGTLSSSSATSYTVANALTLNGTMTLGAATTGALAFNGALTLTGASTLTTSSGVTFSGTGTSAAAYNLSATASAGLYFGGGAGTFTGGTVSFLGGSSVFLASYNNGTPNQLVGFSTIALSGGSNIQLLGNTTHTFANAFTGTASDVVYDRNTSPSGLVFNGTMSSYAGALRIYADSAEGVNPVQKLTLTSATQFAFASFWFQHDAGLTSLSQTLSYTGNGAVTNNNPLYIYGTSTTPTVIFSNDTSSAGTLVTHTNAVQTLNAVTANFRIAATSGPVTFSGVISNPNSGLINLTKTGSSYEATLSGANIFTGTVGVSAGTLNANTSPTALGSTSGGAISVTSGATLSLGAAPTYTGRSLTISGTGTSSTVGALVIANTGTNTFQSITLGATGTYIRATNSGSISAPFTPNNNSIVFGASASSDFTPFALSSNVFSGTGAVTYGGHSLDTGIVRADVRHTYTGNTTLAFGTTYVDSTKELAATGGPLGNKSLTAANTLLMTGGTLSYLAGSVDYSGRFSTGGSQQWKIDVAGQTVTYATALVGASSLSLNDTSTGGSLTLSSASSTFSGGVTITSGTLYAGAAQSGVSGPLGITGTITFSPAGTGVLAYTSTSASFDYSSRFATSSGQSRRINVNGENITFSTAMGGDNAFLLVGSAGTLTLAVANTYTQGTTLSVGTLKCGNATSLGTGGLAQANGTTLQVTATSGKITIQGAHTNTGTGSRIIRIGA